MRRRASRAALLPLLAGLVAGARPIRAEEPRPYLAPFVRVAPGDPRIEALAALPASKPGTNSPGLLLEADTAGGPAAVAAARALAAGASRAGRRAGILVRVAETKVPESGFVAEGVTAETLYPGLGALLAAARGADLFVLDLSSSPAGERAATFVLRRLASEIRAANPSARLALVAGPTERARALLTEENAAYVDVLSFRASPGETGESLRAAADGLVLGKPVLALLPDAADAGTLLAEAVRLAPGGVAFAAAAIPAGSDDALLDRAARLLDGDYSRDGRAASARGADGREMPVFRAVAGLDLGGVVLVPARDAAGAASRQRIALSLDSPSYAAAEVTELETGRSRRFDIPRTPDAPSLTLSTANGPIGVRLVAREKAPAEAAKGATNVTAVRGMTAEEILARHQAWRAARDARWHRFSARNETSYRFRFGELNTTLDLTLAGPFFFEPGKGYDWVWHEAFFNGVKWKGKKVPELPLLQPEKVSELPLALTFNDAYRYALEGDDVVQGQPCWVLSFQPKATVSDKPLYAGRVFVAKSDAAVLRTVSHQLNLAGDVQSADETSEFLEVPAPDGGAPLRFPTKVTTQYILKTFSRTTVVERATTLRDVRVDPPGFDADKAAANASADVMVRDTEQGMRYLEKTKEGGRVVAEALKSSRLFGLGGVYYDDAQSYPLPLLGVYYIDLDFRKKKEQVQVLFGGVLLGASWNDPTFLGSRFDAGLDVFGIAIKGDDKVLVDGDEQKPLTVKSLSEVVTFRTGTAVGRHLKLSASVGGTYRAFGTAKDTASDFTVPSNHLEMRYGLSAAFDLSGWALSAQVEHHRRSKWEGWGLPGNADFDRSKKSFDTWSARLAKDFHFEGFRRLRSSVSWQDSSNTDRFSAYRFGSFAGSGIQGFSSSSLRAERALVVRNAYGLVFGSAFRLEGAYDHAFVTDRKSGLDWTSFGGVGVNGEFPGFWSTMVRLNAGVPVVGRDKGQTGFVLSLQILKIF